jgi:hypothetical protein
LKTLLTPILLDFLIMEGYEYCSSKVDQADVGGGVGYITLTPVKSKLFNSVQNGSIDQYLSITEMIENFEDTLVMVEFDSNDLRQYIGFFMDRLTINRQFYNLNIQEKC